MGLCLVPKLTEYKIKQSITLMMRLGLNATLIEIEVKKNGNSHISKKNRHSPVSLSATAQLRTLRNKKINIPLIYQIDILPLRL